MSAPGEVTRLLGEISSGNESAMNELLPLVYTELHVIAANYFRRERSDHTLQPTALINEAYLRLVDQHATWQNRLHFLSVASIMMRRVLVDHARTYRTAKRGETPQKVQLEDTMVLSEERTAEMIAIDEALTDLASMDPQQGRVVELRFFGGLSIEETAEILQISPSSVKRLWTSARAWLHAEIAKGNA